MMYLLFFGKSQSFTWEAFDQSGHCPNFNQLFPGFEFLESKVMTIDRRENLPVWARYRIKNREGKLFSLLKVYAFAQAFDGSRISGSTYGVALVSDYDIQWDPTNIDILEAARINFSKLVLQHQKFIKTNFLPEAQAVWEGIVGFAEGNLLEKVVVKPLTTIPTAKLLSASFPNIREASPTLERISSDYGRFYVTSDAEHLARMQDKWGVDRFPLFQQPSALPKAPTSTLPPQNDARVRALFSQQNQEIEEEQEEEKTQLPWRTIGPWLLAILGWGWAAYLYLQPAPDVIDPKLSLREWQLNTFSQANKRDTLAILLQNIKLMQTDSNTKYLEAVKRDAHVLKLDSLTLQNLVDTQP